MSEWQGTVRQASSSADPLAAAEGQPILGGTGAGGATFLGRVVIEAWEVPGHPDTTGAAGLAYRASLGAQGKMSRKQFLDLIATAFPKRFAQDRDKTADD